MFKEMVWENLVETNRGFDDIMNIKGDKIVTTLENHVIMQRMVAAFLVLSMPLFFMKSSLLWLVICLKE
jgi:hypothetical protein